MHPHLDDAEPRTRRFAAGSLGELARHAEPAVEKLVDRLADPGNLGTILRSAEAAGADAVVLTPGAADAYNPKTVRASAGALFHVPVVVAGIDDVAAAGLRTIGTSSHDGEGRTVVPHTEADLSGRIAIVLGNEAAGLPAGWTDDDGPIDVWIGIRQHGRTESLNVAMASTVLAFEVARHHTHGVRHAAG